MTAFEELVYVPLVIFARCVKFIHRRNEHCLCFLAVNFYKTVPGKLLLKRSSELLKLLLGCEILNARKFFKRDGNENGNVRLALGFGPAI